MNDKQKQSSIVTGLIVVALLALPLAFAGCGGGSSSISGPTAGSDNLTTASVTSICANTCDATKGGQLYESKGCAGCHGVLAASTKTGVTYQRIKDGITNNPGIMGQYSTLTDDEIYDIAFALGDTKGCEKPVSCDATKGGQLYDSKGCASCHGILAASTKTGVTYQRIKDGITTNPGSMGQYSTLTDEEIYDLAFALGDPKGCEMQVSSSGTGTTSDAGTGSTSDPGSSGGLLGQITGGLPDAGGLTGGLGLPGTGGLTDVLPGTGGLTGLLPGTDSLTGALPGTDGLTDVLPGTGGLTDVLPGTDGLTGLLPGTGGLTDILPGTGGLTDVLPGTDGLTSLLPGTDGLTGALPGTGGLTGLLPGTDGLTGVVSGTTGLLQ